MRGDLPREITLPSAHHSPSTVNRNATELVMGTVRLSSTITSDILVSNERKAKCLTSLSDQ